MSQKKQRERRAALGEPFVHLKPNKRAFQIPILAATTSVRRRRLAYGEAVPTKKETK